MRPASTLGAGWPWPPWPTWSRRGNLGLLRAVENSVARTYATWALGTSAVAVPLAFLILLTG